MTTTTDTGKAIRSALRETFPRVKFSVRESRGTGYGWFSVIWTDGPTENDVREITNPVHRELRHTGGVNLTRHYSSEAERWAASQVEQHPGRWASLMDPPHEPEYWMQRRCLQTTDLREVTL